MTRAQRPAPAEHPELVLIRNLLMDLERQEAQIDIARRRLQDRRAAILEETEGCYAAHGRHH